jgi:cellulose synthase (UDP-forming)
VQVDALPLFQLLGPVAFVLGTIYLLGPILPLSKGWARAAVFATVWVIVTRYLFWRLFSTVLPASGPWYQVGWVWVCFSIELAALTDGLITYIIFLRTTDRRAEADVLERSLRNMPPKRLPSVDVFIPTFNESFDILEKTITGALCLDYPNFNVWVLDDGRRPWLKAFCETKGVGYITRPDNSHAKAGNINHALTRASGEFVAIFDADFIPHRNFLLRTLGFFNDPKIGIVQVPHAFYNHDLMQTNLGLRKILPDDQRFLFEAIMPSRDGWNAAFCCGSNSVTRRAALQTVGGVLPTQSVTEDVLLSLVLLRKGYITRYLCERLAFGLAPESFKAFFVQRQRWARGATQILYLGAGPLGRGPLSLVHRLLFLPTHWLSQSLSLLLTVIVPLVLLWTGIEPLVNVTPESLVYYLAPMVLAVVGGIWLFAPNQYFPLAIQVQGTFQAMRVLPTVLKTLIKPGGYGFKVTPKGNEAIDPGGDRGIFWTAIALMSLTVGGIFINALPDWRIISDAQFLPLAASWALINIVVLFLIAMVSLQAPSDCAAEQFELDEPVSIIRGSGGCLTGWIKDISISDIGIVGREPLDLKIGENLKLFVAEVGFVAGIVVQSTAESLRVRFHLPPSVERDLLIRKLFTSGHDRTDVNASTWAATGVMLKTIWKAHLGETTVTSKLDLITAQTGNEGEKLPARTLVVRPKPRAQCAPHLIEARYRQPADMPTVALTTLDSAPPVRARFALSDRRRPRTRPDNTRPISGDREIKFAGPDLRYAVDVNHESS